MNLPPSFRTNIDLGPLVTLRTPAKAQFFVQVDSLEALREALQYARQEGWKTLILGGGSNLVLARDFDGLVIHMGLKGVHMETLANGDCRVKAMAGENWHQLVCQTVASGLRGLENLALIPGSVGASPVQNIGAYGVELCDTLEQVEVLDPDNDQVLVLSNADCQFAYRHSLFKTDRGRRFIILSVTLRLSPTRPLQIGYGDVANALQAEPEPHTAQQVLDAVVRIRQQKLPDPAQIPNAGSFFKNPIVDCQQFAVLQERFPNLVNYPLADGSYKLAAAWLIDQCGWKGHRDGAVGVHNRQALVLVNPGHGSGQAILDLAARIQTSVQERFGVTLEREPVVP